jgi:hypothetical protein
MTKPKPNQIIQCQRCGQGIRKIGPRKYCPSCMDIVNSETKRQRYYASQLKLKGELANGSNRAGISPKV